MDRHWADLKRFSVRELEQMFGRSARYYHDLCRGIDHCQVEAHRERKSVGAKDTFSTDIETIAEAHRHLVPLMDRVWAVTKTKELAGRTVTHKIKYANFS